jgi:hypothetical protein
MATTMLGLALEQATAGVEARSVTETLVALATACSMLNRKVAFRELLGSDSVEWSDVSKRLDQARVCADDSMNLSEALEYLESAISYLSA